jgi:hypothetical protein
MKISANKSVKIKFIKVGRSKVSWEEEFKKFTSLNDDLYDFLYAEIKKKSLLMSRDIEFQFENGTESKISGSILVGGFRKVGNFEIFI